MSEINTRRIEYKMVVLAILSILSAVFIIWQLNSTTRELEKLATEQESQYDYLLNTIRERREN
jgi:type II secretory pathway pseudopilin PulG